jgi:outer membrane lipoprotein-sorting protein
MTGYDLRVSNGTTTWYYDRENETVRRFRLESDLTGPLPAGGSVERALEAALGETNDTSSWISVLPTLPASDRPAPSGSLTTNGTNTTASTINVTYDGTGQVGGRETYVLSVSAASDEGAMGNYSARIWVDTEWFAILKQRATFSTGDERSVYEVRYRNVTFNPDLGDVSFRFEPPEDANVTTPTTPSVTEYDSRTALERNASMPVPDPDFRSFDFDSGYRIAGEDPTLSVEFTNGTASLSVSVQNATDGSRPDGTAVDLGPTPGYLRAVQTTRVLDWQCGGRSYTMYTSDLRNETIVAAARSIASGDACREGEQSVRNDRDGQSPAASTPVSARTRSMASATSAPASAARSSTTSASSGSVPTAPAYQTRWPSTSAGVSQPVRWSSVRPTSSGMSSCVW